MTKRLMFVLAIFFSLSIISCEKHVIEYPEIDETIPIDFTTEIIPIFTDACVSCHSGGIAPNLSVGNAYNSLIDGEYVNIEVPESSELYTKLLPGTSHDGRITEPNLEKILVWIKQGAKENID
ncbi:MAG: hypothetical protein K9H49_00190 [Bacteroidales bacterium]|nr:hypothetical protein [Bacteroidales bacterium]MCF8389272.1 hypothetical protein [Bacteroidales bacterium]